MEDSQVAIKYVMVAKVEIQKVLKLLRGNSFKLLLIQGGGGQWGKTQQQQKTKQTFVIWRYFNNEDK